MNLNTLNKKYFSTILMVVFMCFSNYLIAQDIAKDKIEIIVGSYKYENNAYLYKIKLKKAGFKKVRVLAKKNGFHRVSISQFKTLKETNKFLDSIGINQIDYWLSYQENHKASSGNNRSENNSTIAKSPDVLVDETNQDFIEDIQNYNEVDVKNEKKEIQINSNTDTIVDDDVVLDNKEDIKHNKDLIQIEKPYTSTDSIDVNIQNSDSFNEPKIELEDVDSLISFDVFKLENKLSIDLPRTSSIFSKPLDSSLIDSLSNKVDNKRETSVNNIFSAKSNYEDYEFSPAIERYLKLARSGRESKEIFESLAIAYYNNSQYDLSTIWFNKLISTYPKNLDPELYFKASVAFKSIEAYEASDRFHKKYLKLNNQLISQNHSEFESNYLDTILNNSGKYNLFKTSINSQNSDFGLNFYNDDKVIFASSLDATGNKKFKWSNEPFLDLFIAKIDSLGNLSNREQLKGSVNTKYHESTATLSKDGNTMYFTRNNFYGGRLKSSKDKEVKLKIYKATKNQDTWGDIEELPFNGNEYSTAHPTLSADGKKLYFSSDMPGTFGMSDIWFVYIFDDKTYSQPINLGPNVNTEFRESFPFIDSGNKLYFSSDGKLGLGGFDIFEIKLNPRGFPYGISNVGKPVNSPFDDFGYVYNDKRNFGFISSNRNGLNGSSSDEVYKIVKTDGSNQSFGVPSPCKGSISGVVFDKFTKKLLKGASVKLLNDNDNVIKEILTNNLGEFNFIQNFDCSKSYLIRVSNGISYTTRVLNLDFKQTIKIVENIDLEWTTNCLPNDLICILGVEPIFFDLDKATLRSSSIKSLNNVLIALIKYPSMTLQISSYADSRASLEYNKVLSRRRAIRTKNWLTSKGIDSSRLIIKALGEENVDNICLDNPDCTEEDYQLNRKSIFKILTY